MVGWLSEKVPEFADARREPDPCPDRSQARPQTGWCRGDERDMSTLKRLGDLERSIMDHLWDTGGHRRCVRSITPSVRSVTWPTPPS